MKTLADLSYDELLARAAAVGDLPELRVDVSPFTEGGKRWWTKGEGLKKWATKPRPWTALYHHILKWEGMTPAYAARIASSWYHIVFGHWPGEHHGKKHSLVHRSADGAGYGTVAVTANTWLRERANEFLFLNPLPELPDDDPMGDLDEDTLALLLALAELDVDAEEGLRSFDPNLHKRWPKGHPLGGKFRSMVDLLKMAIAEHKPGDKDHPFEKFTRPQLVNAAKARGIPLKRGEDRDSIAKKLLADLGGAAGGKAAKLQAPKAPKAVPDRPKPKSLGPQGGQISAHEQNVRDAFAELKKPSNDWVGLPQLREELAARGMGRKAQDDELKRLLAEGKIRLIPEENQKTIRQAEKSAAIKIGGEDMHLIGWVGTPPQREPSTPSIPPAVTTRVYAHQLTPDDNIIWTDPQGVDHEVQIISRRIRNITMPDGEPGLEMDVEGLRGEGYAKRTIRLGLNEPVRKVDKRATAAQATAPPNPSGRSNRIPARAPRQIRARIDDEIRRQTALAPQATAGLQHVGIATDTEWEQMIASGQAEEKFWAGYQPNNGGIVFSPRWRTDRTELNKRLVHAYESGELAWSFPDYSTKNLDMAGGIFRHEFGHHVASLWPQRGQPWTESQRKKLIDPLAEELGVPAPTDGDVASWLRLNLVRNAVIGKVSKRAADSVDELLAELWSVYSGRGEAASPAAKRVGRAMQAAWAATSAG